MGTQQPPSPAPTPTPVAARAPQASPSAGPVLQRSVPKRLKIAAIAVDAPFVPLALGVSGQLNAPPSEDSNLVGWFEGGPTPGELGTSIIAGHLDTKQGPAVFMYLYALKPGSKVEVQRTDGTTATFAVDSVETFSKEEFPDERVYADAPSAQLRLITCGGDYDTKAKDYKSNTVVFAHLVSSSDTTAQK
ncbi:class F sortase [Streptomyces sp. NPDC006879]|uniref:class F sortase n=1 Tax=Streptomyces sp. NPDC006879 TaxID=3364767 RepID=UPI0036BEB6C1